MRFQPVVACSPAKMVPRSFFEGGLFTSRIPSSWLRFLWFMTVLGIASFSLIAGQGQRMMSIRRCAADICAGQPLQASTSKLFLTPPSTRRHGSTPGLAVSGGRHSLDMR